ncbi:uncharacterized protein [Physcomitrium patens]|uniref:uncharacterized protein isoform X3 n=1 Tax=Physcomitrium patens TaxID=3218 RepID=UPI003CCDC978
MEKLDEAKGQKEELKVGEFENLSNSSSPKTKEEIWKKEVPIPPFYFQPTLVDMLVPIKALHYKDYPYFADMPEEIRERIVALLPIDLPLDLISDLITEESYWKRRSLSRWRNVDIACHGDSWKQLYFERNLSEFIESYELTKDLKKDLQDLLRLSAAYVHNINLQKLPSHLQLLLINEELQWNLSTLKIEYGDPNACMSYDIKKIGMLNSDCISMAAFCSVTHTLTELNLSSNALCDDHVLALVDGMVQNPTIVNLDLSHNMISDVGCEHLARLLNAKNCILLFLNLCNNQIKKMGTQAIGYSLSTNKSLLSLNLRLNDLGDYGGHRVFEYMMDNQVIQRLSMSATGFSVEGVEALTKLLHLPQSELQYLDISANPGIGPAQGQTIYAALVAKKKMKELHIKKCGIGVELEAQFDGLLQALNKGLPSSIIIKPISTISVSHYYMTANC